MKKRLSLLLMLVTIFMVSCQSNEKKDDYVSKRGTETAAETAAETSKETVKEEISKVRMKFLGDIFPHWKQVWYAQARGESGKYDFQDNFALIKDYTSDADITIVNNELSTNPKRKVSTYPIFNIPEGIYDTYKTMGVDIVNTANNHSVDGGFEGIDTTIDAIHKRGLENFGTQKDESTPYLIKEVNGIKIGFLSYTYGLNGFEQSMDTPEEKAKITLLSNEEKIKSDIEKVKEQGAAFVLIYAHWGEEYQSLPNESQKEIARKMADWGAGAIIGMHPHVIQPMEVYKTADGRDVNIYYSLGNVFSNQRKETMGGDIRTEQGYSVEMVIEKSNLKDQATIKEAKVHPIWIGSRKNEFGLMTRVHMVDEYLNNGPKASKAQDWELERMKKAKKAVEKTISTKID